MNLVTAEELDAAASFLRPFFLVGFKANPEVCLESRLACKRQFARRAAFRVLVGFGIDFAVCLESSLACKRQIARRAAFKGGAKHAGNIPEPSHKAWECLNQQRDSAPVPTIFLRLLSGCW